MVGDFRMRHISARRCRHVARGAIRMIQVVFGSESRAMASEALASIECDSFFP